MRVGGGPTGLTVHHADGHPSPGPAQQEGGCPVGPGEGQACSWPFSKRRLASLRSAYRNAVRRMLTGSKMADSTMTLRVSSPTSLVAPPMTPAMASGPRASAMSSVSVVSSRSTWSSVSSRSPGLARRTTMRPSWMAAASKVWMGLPSSSIT